MAAAPSLPEDISLKCKVHLEQPPKCDDISGVRGYAICWAQWVGVKQEHLDFSGALKEGWRRAKESCAI